MLLLFVTVPYPAASPYSVTSGGSVQLVHSLQILRCQLMDLPCWQILQSDTNPSINQPATCVFFSFDFFVLPCWQMLQPCCCTHPKLQEHIHSAPVVLLKTTIAACHNASKHAYTADKDGSHKSAISPSHKHTSQVTGLCRLLT